MAAPVSTKAPIVRKLISSTKVGVVVSAGKMDRAVKVRIAGQEWNKKFRKHFPSPQTHLVADPQNSLVEGDVVRIASGFRTSKSIRHVVTAIVAPFGAPVEERPPVPTDEQRMDGLIKKRILKDVRSAARGRRTSEQRLIQARKQGHEIPSLEEAMANVKVAEEEEKARKESGKSGAPVVGNVKQEVKKALEAGRKLKEARMQTHTS
ncbi:nucleic acid-binding protein [Massarina eburnea CBS 473.64]|uniref:Nucleic acid-binding protein n=1 Tax=Massarina eburnea CBS 473.64 TaxID=1395130 RepID=A0A6A6RGT4_9PLEO|nr:nucleic acid-binding protein [Massarina eburnea CBS 473.64]